jgi:hypothetical protein
LHAAHILGRIYNAKLQTACTVSQIDNAKLATCHFGRLIDNAAGKAGELLKISIGYRKQSAVRIGGIPVEQSANLEAGERFFNVTQAQLQTRKITAYNVDHADLKSIDIVESHIGKHANLKSIDALAAPIEGVDLKAFHTAGIDTRQTEIKTINILVHNHEKVITKTINALGDTGKLQGSGYAQPDCTISIIIRGIIIGKTATRGKSHHYESRKLLHSMLLLRFGLFRYIVSHFLHNFTPHLSRLFKMVSKKFRKEFSF